MPSCPDPAGAIRLFTSLPAASLGQNSLPLDVRLVIGVDGGVDVERVLQVLASAGVDHRPLHSLAKESGGRKKGHTKVGVSLGTQEMKIILLL